jgi:hypothetical protein
MRVNFLGGPSDLKLRKEKKTCLEFRNQLATQKKIKKRLLKLCNGANNVQIRVWRRDDICFFLFVF